MYAPLRPPRYSASRFRPFFRRSWSTFRPPGELILARKPWVRFRGIRFG
jgi:hypothetical protein